MGAQYQLIIVDDEPKLTQSLEREIRLEFLEEQFVVVSFNNPELALAHIREHAESVFLVISDLRMPEMNGSNLLALVRETCPEAQTILLTAFTDIDSIQTAISASIQSLLFKPWTRESIVAEVNKALEIWNLRKENTVLNKRIVEMLRSAGEFQERLFAQVTPTLSGISFDVKLTPYEAYHCGGDFYAIIDDGNDNVMILLGDVSGHGPKPAMIAGMVRMAIDSIIDANPSLRTMPDKLLTLLNCRLCSLLACSPDTLIGLTAVHINTKGRTLAVATSGLPPVAHIRSGSPELLSTPNHMLGAFPETSYYKTERFLLPGDRVVLFTDGLVETIPSFFALPHEDIAGRFAHRTDYGIPSILADFKVLLPGMAFTDDVTVISMEIDREE